MNLYHWDELGLTLFEEAGDALFLFDPETEQLLDMNPMAQRLSGFTRKELLSRPVTYLFRSEVPGGMRRLRLAFQKTGMFHSQEGFLLRHQNDSVWIPVKLTITRLHTEKKALGLVTARDVHEQRETLAQLKKLEERLRTVMANAPVILFALDRAGMFTLSEGRALEALGLKPGEAVGRSVFELYRDAPQVLHHVRRALAGETFTAVVEVERGPGAGRVFETHYSPFRDQQGLVQGIVGIATDVTDRKQAEEALRASEAKYRSLIENLEQSIFLKDCELRFVAANKPFCRSLGLTEAEIVGKTDFDFYPPHLAAKYRADDLVVLTEGKRLELEEENIGEGKIRTVRVVKTPLKDDQGRIVGVLGIFWDVTEQRLLEAQLSQAQKMEAIGQLAGGIAHDFNNLMTVILGNISLIGMALPQGDPLRELVAEVEKAGWRAAELTSQLLGFSRRTPIRPQPLRLAQCIEDTIRILRRTIDPRIALEGRCAADLWTVKADPGQMNQVLMNLCLNARDAMPEGGRLSLEAENVVVDETYTRRHLEARPGAYVRLRVRDTGHGIPPEILPRIFEPFFTTKGPGKGTGLGLAMVFGIIKQHGGWVECTSEVNQGACFDIYLPRSAPERDSAVIPTLPPPCAGGETILLVDDEATIRSLGQTILQHYGYRVLLAEDGIEAVQIYQQEKPRIALVILDLTMPRLSGPDTLRQLLQINPEVRVIFTSGYSAEDVSAFGREHVLGFLGKPYRPEDLAVAVHTALDKAKTQSAARRQQFVSS